MIVVYCILCTNLSHLKLSVILMYTKQLLSKLTLPDFNQLQRSTSSSAISERTLEECWTTLQRVSWILFNRVAYSSSGAACCLVALLPALLLLFFFCYLCQMSLGSFCFRFVTNTLNRFVYTARFFCLMCAALWVWEPFVVSFFVLLFRSVLWWSFFELSWKMFC